MSKKEGLRAHLEELKRKHRNLDVEINKHAFITDEVRRMKTQKLWLKDEIHRVQKELESMETRINGHA